MHHDSTLERSRSTTPPARWLSAREAAAYVGVSRSTLHRYRAEGLVPKKIRGRLVYDRLAIDAFLEGADASGQVEA